MANERIYSRRKKDQKVEKEGETPNHIDHLPKCFQQPRSRTFGCPKRRTDFSLFFCSRLSSPSCAPDLSPESPGSKDGSCILSATSQDGSPGKSKIYPSIHLVSCHQSEYAVEGGEAKSSRLQNEVERTQQVHPDKLTVIGWEDICRTPVDGRRSASDSNEHMTSEESASLDPVRGISHSEDGSPCSLDISPSEQPVEHPAEPNFSTEGNETIGADGLKSVTLSRVRIDHQERGRGMRKRKPKVHFDELKHPKESVKRVRRLRIMRQLGLAAPVGSPFTAFNQH